MYTRLLKSLNRLNPRAWDFIQLTRMDKPIGIYLLLWPTLWALWIAGKGSPSLSNIVIFVLGVAADFSLFAAIILPPASRRWSPASPGHARRTGASSAAP